MTGFLIASLWSACGGQMTFGGICGLVTFAHLREKNWLLALVIAYVVAITVWIVGDCIFGPLRLFTRY